MKVAIVYDWLNKIGGAEQVLVNFYELFPDADWFTSVWEPSRFPASRRWKVHASWLSKIPYLRTHHELLPVILPFIFEGFDLSGYDLVISIGSAASKGVITKPGTFHLNYCLTPTRYLWSHKKGYLSTIPRPLRPLASYVMGKLQKWDLIASQRPDKMISISECVKKRVKKYYNIDSEVIFPPVNTHRYNGTPTPPFKEKGYYLIVSRLVPYKNIELAIEVFNKSKETLIIIGTGSERKKLRRMANSNIILLGTIPDVELPDFYRYAKGYLQCNEEDFGISMVEALSAGTPVVAYSRGGALDIVTSSTGVLYNELSWQSLDGAIKKLEKSPPSPAACRQRAEIFDKNIWQQQIRERIETYVKGKS